MTFTNEYKFDTPENREFAIRNIAVIAADGFVIIFIEEDGAKVLVTFQFDG